MDSSNLDVIKATLQELVAELAPDIRFVPKYGGEVMCPDPENDKAFVAGVFCYKNHVSLEFSEGASLSDPDKRLEGSGKKRRHLKLRTLDDITAKDARGYLIQILDP